jgi:FKBP12-rapamycin complex-associated protein
VYAQLKFLWAQGPKEETLEFLREFSAQLFRDIQQETTEQAQHRGNKQRLAELSKLLGRCYFKQGQWQTELSEDWSTVSYLLLA